MGHGASEAHADGFSVAAQAEALVAFLDAPDLIEPHLRRFLEEVSDREARR